MQARPRASAHLPFAMSVEEVTMPLLVGFHDATIDPVGKAKVICIHDQATHAVSLAGGVSSQRPLRVFLCVLCVLRF